MSCDILVDCTAIVDFVAYSSPADAPGDCVVTRAAELAPEMKRCRAGPAGDLPEAKALRHQMRSRVIADTTHIDPQSVWGDEGPIND
jgi:hypothetical protein